MKKKILSILLAVLMVMTSAPASIFATELGSSPIPIDEVNFEYTDFNFSDFTIELPKAPDGAKYVVDSDNYQIGLIKGSELVYNYNIVDEQWTKWNGNEYVQISGLPDISEIDKAFINFKLIATDDNTFAENTVKVTAEKGTSSKELSATGGGILTEGFDFDNSKQIECNLLFAPTKIADILATYSNFPSTSTDDAPIDAWVDDITGRASYIDKDGALVLSGFYSMNINTVLTKDNENYKTSYNGLSLTFKMESGVLKEIECIFMNTVATFAPYDFVNEERETIVGSTEEVEFKTNANYKDDQDNVTVKVQLEGEANPTTLTYNSDYYLQTGSTIVKLKGDYVKTLPVGTHTITIEVDGYPSVSQQFKIKPAPTPTPDPTLGYTAPKTGVK